MKSNHSRRDFLKHGAAVTVGVVTALSEKSVAGRSRPVDFPDFTKGKGKTNPHVRILGV